MAPIDTGRIEAAVAAILVAIGEEPGRPGLRGTPSRVAESYAELFSGIGVDPLRHLESEIGVDGADSKIGDLVIVRDIEFRSVCEHHMLPFTGRAHVAYRPRARIAGFGSMIRVVETLASRPQLQERLTDEIAEAISVGLEAVGVLVMLDATHGCVTARGPRQLRSTAATITSRGSLSNPVEQSGALSLLSQGIGSIRIRPPEDTRSNRAADAADYLLGLS
jgi:GTP cyclohydrolase I